MNNLLQIYKGDILDIKTNDNDMIFIETCEEPESKLIIVWDGNEGWNIYRRDLFLINIPYDLAITQPKQNKV